VILSIALLPVLLPSGTAAQKARPVRIEVECGSLTSVVSGRLRGRQQMEYVVAVDAERALGIELAGSPGNPRATG